MKKRRVVKILFLLLVVLIWMTSVACGDGSTKVKLFLMTEGGELEGSPTITLSKNMDGNYIVPTLPTPTRSGFSFDGWYRDDVRFEDTIIILTESEKLEREIIINLKAKWTNGGENDGSSHSKAIILKKGEESVAFTAGSRGLPSDVSAGSVWFKAMLPKSTLIEGLWSFSISSDMPVLYETYADINGELETMNYGNTYVLAENDSVPIGNEELLPPDYFELFEEGTGDMNSAMYALNNNGIVYIEIKPYGAQFKLTLNDRWDDIKPKGKYDSACKDVGVNGEVESVSLGIFTGYVNVAYFCFEAKASEEYSITVSVPNDFSLDYFYAFQIEGGYNHKNVVEKNSTQLNNTRTCTLSNLLFDTGKVYMLISGKCPSWAIPYAINYSVSVVLS